jgi:hypothetical protein
MIGISLDITDTPVFEVYFDAAAAGAHVADGGADLVGDGRRQVDDRLGRQKDSLQKEMDHLGPSARGPS